MKTNIRLKTDFISRVFLLTVLLTLVQMSLSAQQKSLSAQQWKELHTGVTEDLYDVCCIDTSTVFACGQNGVILKTIDGGESWIKLYEKPDNRMTLIAFADELTGYSYRDSIVIDSGPLSYHNRQLLKTTDGGTTWMELGDPYLGFPLSVAATGLYCLDTATLLICSDGGNTWKFCYDGLNCYNSFWAIDGIDTVYYIAAGNGIVYRTGTPDWFYPWDLDETPSMNEPLIYPNPVENLLSFDGADAELVEVFDSNGRKLFSNQIDGSFTLDISQYTPGIYLIRITDGQGRSVTKKIIKK